MEWLLEALYVKSYYRILGIIIFRILWDFNILPKTRQWKFQGDYTFPLKNLTSMQSKWFCIPKKMLNILSFLLILMLMIRFLPTGSIIFELIVNGNACWERSGLTKYFSNDVEKGKHLAVKQQGQHYKNILFLIE